MPGFKQPSTKGERNINSKLKDKDREALIRCYGILTAAQAAKAFDLNEKRVQTIWRQSIPKDLDGKLMPAYFIAFCEYAEREREGMPKEFKCRLLPSGMFDHVNLTPKLANKMVRVTIHPECNGDTIPPSAVGQ